MNYKIGVVMSLCLPIVVACCGCADDNTSSSTEPMAGQSGEAGRRTAGAGGSDDGGSAENAGGPVATGGSADDGGGAGNAGGPVATGGSADGGGGAGNAGGPAATGGSADGGQAGDRGSTPGTAAGAPSSGGGEGGESGDAGSAGGGAGACAWDYPECCSVPDRMPCRGLSELECNAREYCMSVEGGHYDPEAADPIQSAAEGAQVYLGCFTAECGAIWMSASTCVYDPAATTRCYVVDSETPPDGWEAIEDCSNPHDGFCTE